MKTLFNRREIELKLLNLRLLLSIYLTPQDTTIFLVNVFVLPIFFLIAFFIVNVVINIFINPFPTKIWSYEIWALLPFYAFMVIYFVIFNITRSYKKMNKNVLSAAALLIVLISAGFYWFQIRPSKMTKICNKEWINYSVGQSNNSYDYYASKFGDFDSRDEFMKNCLASQGMKQ